MSSAHHWSIRRRLTRGVLGLVVLAWIATILLAALLIRHEMNEVFDEELQTVAEATALYLDEPEGLANPRVIGLTSASGNRVLRVTRPRQDVIDALWPALFVDGFHDATGWRVFRLSTDNAVIEVGHNTAWRLREAMEAASSLLILILPMIALLLWGLRRSLSQALTPLERLAEGIGSRRTDDLSPVKAEGLPQEALPLVSGMNEYIARIEALRLAERQFIANAAHELRTPIASIRAGLELSGDPDARSAVPQLDSLTHRLERLLQLSRSEAGLGLGDAPSDLVQILRLVIEETARHTDRPIHFDDGDYEVMNIPFDPDTVAILIRNLLENAVQHGSGVVRVRLGPDGALQIENPTSNAAFLEQPFRRGAASEGAGLGLSIVATLVKAMGIDIEKQITDGRAVVTLSFLTRAQ